MREVATGRWMKMREGLTDYRVPLISAATPTPARVARREMSAAIGALRLAVGPAAAIGIAEVLSAWPALPTRHALTLTARAALTLRTTASASATPSSAPTRCKGGCIRCGLPLHFTGLANPNPRAIRQTVGAVHGHLFSDLEPTLDIGSRLV